MAISPNPVPVSVTHTTSEALQVALDDAASLITAIDQCKLLLPKRALDTGHWVSRVLDLYPRCIAHYQQTKSRSPMTSDSSRTANSIKLRQQACSQLRKAIVRFSYVSTLEHQSLQIPEKLRGVPTELTYALQLKATLRSLQAKRLSEGGLSARAVTEVLLHDIMAAADAIDLEVPCLDIVDSCELLVKAIRSDTMWPEPYLGRELEADTNIRLAHSILCSLADNGTDSRSLAQVSKLRNLLDQFINRDGDQTSHLVPRRPVSWSLTSPATSVNSFNSVSTIMTPTPIAEWYFSNLHLDSALEIEPMLIARGGFGNVFRGTWMKTEVAIKLIGCKSEDATLSPSFTRQTDREKLIWGKVYHENILPLFGIADWNGQDALVSPWIQNNDARHYFKNLSTSRGVRYTGHISRDTIPMYSPGLTDECVDERLKFICQVAYGLVYLHRRNIVHGDIRLSNVLVSHEGDALIMDFGLSKSNTTKFAVDPSTTFERSGSFRWMAPELLDENPSRTKQSDVWAFACFVLEFFSGISPHQNKLTDQQVLLGLIGEEKPFVPKDLRERVPELWQVLDGCWNSHPGARPPMDVLLLSLLMLRTKRGQLMKAIVSN